MDPLKVDKIRQRVWHSISYYTAQMGGDGLTQAKFTAIHRRDVYAVRCPVDAISELPWGETLMTETPAGGLQLIREAVAARKSVLATMARDCALSIDLLDAFANGRSNIPAENLGMVVKWCWNDYVEYNAEADALQPIAQPEARSIGVRPTWNIDLPKFTLGPLQRSGPQPEAAPPVKKQRAGWIGGERIDAAADERARGVIIRRLRRALVEQR